MNALKSWPRSLRLLIAVVLSLLILAIIAGRLALHSPSAPAASLDQTASLPLKIISQQPGLTRITADDLRAAGLDPSQIDPARWQLRRGDQPVPLLPLADLSLIYYAEAANNPYSRQQIYWLETAPEQGLRPAGRQIDPAPASASNIVSDTYRLDWRSSYHPRLLDGEDRWLGPVLNRGKELALPLDLPVVAPGPARLRLQVWANTASPQADPDHHLQIWLNDQLVGEGWQEGHGFWQIEAQLPAGLLVSGENHLRLQAPGDTGSRVEQDYPAWIEIDYPRQLVLGDGPLEFPATGRQVQVAGLSGDVPLLLWDVSRPAAPIQLQGARLAVANGTLRFIDSSAPSFPRRYALTNPAQLPGPAQIARPRPGDLRSAAPASYIAIGPPDLLEPLQPLLDWRKQAGLSTLSVDVEAVTEQFDAGRRGPEAIRNFLRFAAAEWPVSPQFLLLVGDASYDPLGYSGDTRAERVPTCLVDTHFVGQTASDHCYADLNDDLLPELAVGRLPAQTAGQVTALVDKIIAYEQAGPDSDWLGRALLIADAEPQFLDASEDIAARVLAPAGYQIERLYMAEPDLDTPDEARPYFLGQLKEGVGLINYAGHGSPRWWAGELLSSEDAANLPNAGRWPIVSAMTCLTGFFQHPSVESLAEALLWAEGGAVAVFAPSSEGVTAEQLPLAEAFYRHVTAGDAATLGEAILAAKQDMVKTDASSEDMIRTFNLLGDPALRLPGAASNSSGP